MNFLAHRAFNFPVFVYIFYTFNAKAVVTRQVHRLVRTGIEIFEADCAFKGRLHILIISQLYLLY